MSPTRRAWPRRAALVGIVAAVALSAAWSTAGTFELGGKPLDVTAERLDVDLAGRTATLAGKVVVKRGDLTLTCPKLDARFGDGGAIVWAKTAGPVVVESREGRLEAEQAELDLAKRTLELRGRVNVTRGGSRLTAEIAVVDLSTHKVSLRDVRGTLAAPPASSSP